MPKGAGRTVKGASWNPIGKAKRHYGNVRVFPQTITEDKLAWQDPEISSPDDRVQADDSFRHTPVSETTRRRYSRNEVREAFAADDHVGTERFSIRPLD